MARARNLKPSFFTNEELAEVPPLGRLLFQGMWCHADREGRLEDRPKRMKAEILPYDACDVEVLLNDLHLRGFIRRYSHGEGRYIQVLKFSKHQNPHVKEAASAIPAPDEHSTSTVLAPEIPERAGLIPSSLNPPLGCGVGAPAGAAPPESAESEAPDGRTATGEQRGTRLPDDWVCPRDWLQWAQRKRGWSEDYVLEVALAFRNYWTGRTGKDARRRLWDRTWQNWVIAQNAPVAKTRSRADQVHENMDILTGKVRHERVISGTSNRVGGAAVLSLPGDLREQDGDDVGPGRPSRSAIDVG